jgi:deazaflavin-dependent oxidoreductase (nitroreductase family)
MSQAALADLPKPNKTPLIRFALAAQSFLLRRNWAGPMGDFVMVLVHRGRRTGKRYETPVAYLRQGADILAISNGKIYANWFLNIVAAGEAEIVIKGETQSVRVARITDPAAIAETFETFRAEYKGFERAFRIKRDAPPEHRQIARDRMAYLRLSPKTAARA